MANRIKLTEKMLRDAEPRPGLSYQIFDTEVIGLAARVQASGARTFTIDYRFGGRQRRMTIGRWPEWSVTAARERAKELRRAIDAGSDPLVEQLFDTFDRLRQEVSIIIVDHNLDLALTLSDRTVALERGSIIHEGPSATLAHDIDLRRQVLWL